MNRLGGVALVLIGLLAGGCFFPNFGAFGDEEFPLPTVLATYTTGSARLHVSQSSEQGGSGEVVILDRVGQGSALNSLTGATVSWRNDDGWLLQLTVYEFGLPFLPVPTGAPEDESYSADVTVQRIIANEFWTARGVGPSGNRCIVDVAESSETVVRGSATCRGLRWQDGTVPDPFGDPIYIEGQEPFEAEITFEATP
ncbi:MAG: hypothetical protein WD830_11730 [Chloroflexota bacterium]